MTKFPLWGIILILGTLLIGQTIGKNVNGTWSPWAVFNTPCNVTCGGGFQVSYRSCSNPFTQGSGSICTKDNGDLSEYEEKVVDCNTQSCFEGMWSNWTLCDNCTIGQSFRVNICENVTITSNGTCSSTDLRYTIEYESCNRWQKGVCPSPCLDLICPDYGVCNDISSDEGPATECVCTMNRKMNKDGTSCVRPPPTTPTPRPIPTLAPAQKTVATFMSKTASVLLIIFVGITLILFFVLRIFTPDRIIQMNMEIALISAHLFLMFPPSTVENIIMCKIVSICIHLCFLACYNFMMLEALHMYFMVAYIVKKDGAFSRLQNTLLGWGLSLFVILLCICFEYENYGGSYHCWLQLDTSLVYGVFIPIIIVVIVTFTLIEAAGAANYKPLLGYDKKQQFSAKISQRTNLFIIPFILAHWIVGMFSEYEQNLPLYGTFSVLNGITGFMVFFFHCSNNQQVREKLKIAYKKMSSGSSL